MEQLRLQVKGSYLFLPIWMEGKQSHLSLHLANGMATSFLLNVSQEAPSTHVPVPIRGKYLLAEGDERILSLLYFANNPRYAPSGLAFHYAPCFGWINDPNGLVKTGGTYHLYYQYNPVGRKWGNMSWGHATSNDLITWTQQDAVLFPDDENHVIFSGSGIEEEGMLYFPYTLANLDNPSLFSQHLAISEDGGMHLRELGTIIPTIEPGNRDPKVFHYKGNRYLVLWMRNHEFALFQGDDWFHWNLCNRFDAPPFWECPDIYFLGDKVFFTAADGQYKEADFDGQRLLPKKENHFLFLTSLPYATQSYSGTGGDTIIIPWLRTKNENRPTRGVMGLPRVLGLAEKNGTSFIRKDPPSGFYDHFTQGGLLQGTLLETELEGGACRLTLTVKKRITGKIGNLAFTYDPSNGIFHHEEDLPESSMEETLSNAEDIVFETRPLILEFLIDGFIAEISNSEHLELAHVEIDETKTQKCRISITSKEDMRLTVQLFRRE